MLNLWHAHLTKKAPPSICAEGPLSTVRYYSSPRGQVAVATTGPLTELTVVSMALVHDVVSTIPVTRNEVFTLVVVSVPGDVPLTYSLPWLLAVGPLTKLDSEPFLANTPMPCPRSATQPY